MANTKIKAILDEIKSNNESYKLTEEDIQVYGLQGLQTNTLYGADNVKKTFDKLVEFGVKPKLNSLITSLNKTIDELTRINGSDTAPSGAEYIGCQAIDNLLLDEENNSLGGSVRDMLIALNTRLTAFKNGSIDDNFIETKMLADNAVTTAKMKDGNVTAAKIDTSAITESKIASSAISEGKLQDKAVTKAKLSQELQDKVDLIGKPIAMDSEPTLNSVNPVKSNGLYQKFAEVNSLYDSLKAFAKSSETKITLDDLGESVKASLSRADSALQSFTETDPTVPAWAKQVNKPAYTKSEIGLGLVDNTSDNDKPISAATQAALNGKVDKVDGKGLSSNDFTTMYKNALDGLNTALNQKVNCEDGKGLSSNDFTSTYKSLLDGLDNKLGAKMDKTSFSLSGTTLTVTV